jgi:hypothetical protein
MPRVKIDPSCQICLTKDETQFYPRIKNKCRVCVLTERKEQYKPVKESPASKPYNPRDQNITKKGQTKPQPKPYRTVPLRKVNTLFDVKMTEYLTEMNKQISTVEIDAKTAEIKKYHKLATIESARCARIYEYMAQMMADFAYTYGGSQ